jgi:hypothetical protein
LAITELSCYGDQGSRKEVGRSFPDAASASRAERAADLLFAPGL